MRREQMFLNRHLTPARQQQIQVLAGTALGRMWQMKEQEGAEFPEEASALIDTFYAAVFRPEKLDS